MTDSDAKRYITQCNLSSVLYNICLEHHRSLKKDNPEIPDLPHFISESIHDITKALSKILNNNIYDTDYWHQIVVSALTAKSVLVANKEAVKENENAKS
jgi:hypothetical protein